jgi:cyclophilin family peptidyl-prolyl cis-trans isomerase
MHVQQVWVEYGVTFGTHRRVVFNFCMTAGAKHDAKTNSIFAAKVRLALEAGGARFRCSMNGKVMSALNRTVWSLVFVSCAQVASQSQMQPHFERVTETEASPQKATRVTDEVLRTLAMRQDAAVLPQLLQALDDASCERRTAAADALGLLSLSWTPLPDDVKRLVSEGTLKREEVEQKSEPKCSSAQQRLLWTMGRLDTPDSAERLVQRAEARASGAAVSLGVRAKRGVPLTDGIVDRLAALLAVHETPEWQKWELAYALAQSKSPRALPSLRACAHRELNETQALCVKGLADQTDALSQSTFASLVPNENAHTAFESMRGLLLQAKDCQKSPCAPLDSAFAEANSRLQKPVALASSAHFLLGLLQQPMPQFALQRLISMRRQFSKARRLRQDAGHLRTLSVLDCRAASAIDVVNDVVTASLACGDKTVTEQQRLTTVLHALGSVKRADCHRVDSVKRFLAHENSGVRAAAVDALQSLQCGEVVRLLRPMVHDTDKVVAISAAAALASLGDQQSLPALEGLLWPGEDDPAMAPLAEGLVQLKGAGAKTLLTRWLKSPQASLRHAAQAALRPFNGAPVVAPFVEPPPWPAASAEADDVKHLQVLTSKGTFEIQLDRNVAPKTSTHMAQLALNHFFDSLTFHRIVPHFVAQGGDPRGDGEGGPGFVVPCENSGAPYERGVVGMALSGKDTGGSQFFVTLSKQPHLEGRYTVFGHVTEGIEVAERLVEGDVMIEVRAVR